MFPQMSLSSCQERQACLFRKFDNFLFVVLETVFSKVVPKIGLQYRRKYLIVKERMGSIAPGRIRTPQVRSLSVMVHEIGYESLCKIISVACQPILEDVGTIPEVQ